MAVSERARLLGMVRGVTLVVLYCCRKVFDVERLRMAGWLTGWNRKSTKPTRPKPRW